MKSSTEEGGQLMKHCQVEVQKKYFSHPFFNYGKIGYKVFQIPHRSSLQYTVVKTDTNLFLLPHVRNIALI